MAGCGLRCSKCGKTARVIWDSTPAEVSKILGRDCGYLINGLKSEMASSDLDWSDKIHCSVCGGEMMPLGNEGKDFELRCKLQKEWVKALVKSNKCKNEDDDEEIDYFVEMMPKLKALSVAAIKLNDIMAPNGEPERRNLVHYVFLRKTTRLLFGILHLVSMHLEEEAQILIRVQIEIKINFDYFTLIAKRNLEKAIMRIFDYSTLDTIKWLESLDFKFGEHSVDRSEWDVILKNIKSRYSASEFKKLKKKGFSGLSAEAMASKTENNKLYNLAFRRMSSNVHSSNLGEQLKHVISPNDLGEYERTRTSALMYIFGKCSFDVIKGCNDWLGKPIADTELDDLRIHGGNIEDF